MQCKFCQNETDQQVVFGIYERTHYDNRHDTADRDTGKTTFEATAIVKVPYCPNCGSVTKGLVMKKDLTSIGICLIGALVCGIIAHFLSTGSSSDSSSNGFLLLGMVVFLVAMVVMIVNMAIHGISTQAAVKERCMNDYKEANEISAYDIFAPMTGIPIKISPLQGNLSNRWDVSYRTISKKRLEKANAKDPKVGGTKAQALYDLRYYYHD